MSAEQKIDFGGIGLATERDFFRVLDGTPDALILSDGDGVIRFANLQAERLFGYPREELLGQAIELLVPARFRGSHVSKRKRYVEHPTVRPMGSGLQLFGLRKGGDEFPIEISLSPLQTDQGVFIASSVRDVSERKRMEESERLATQRLYSAIESIEGMFALFDADDRLVLCNSEFRQFFSAAGAGVGAPFHALVEQMETQAMFTPADDGAVPTAKWLENHRAPQGTLDLRTRDGHTLRVAERRTAERGIVTTIWDISDDVARAEELRQARLQAEAGSAAKSEFLSSMSHELRTPLNAVLGFAQLLWRDKKTPLNERQKERLEHILKGGEHLLRLIDDVLDLSRIEAGRLTISIEPVRIADVLTEAQSTLEPMAARANVRLEVASAIDLSAEVRADRTRFVQVLINYGSNAIKYGKDGGLVTFHVSRPSAEILRVAVADRGQGIPPEKHERLWQPFQRAGQELGPIEGTGIGLTICKRVAELMGGSVGFRSGVGEGSEFWIDLPVVPELVRAAAHEEERSAPRGLSAPSATRHTILYVEDNPSNIAFMRDLLTDFEAIELLVAPTAEIGLELARGRLPKVVIMDINLPGIDGIEAARQLKAWPETAAIPIVALSAAAMKSDRQRAQAAVFHRYLTKPVQVDELMDTLEPLLAAE